MSFGYEANDRFEVLRGDLNPKSSSEEQEAEFEAGTHIGFISLSEVEENPYMWGYYAEQYKGARLKIQFKVREIKVNEGEVRYLRVDAVAPRQKVLISINRARFDGEYIEPCEYEVNRLDKINTDLSKCTKNIISNKHISWDGEREYRILYSINNISGNDVSPLLKKTKNGMFVTADLNRFAVALECGPFSKISISDIKREFAKDSLLRGVAVRRLSFVPGLYRTQCSPDGIYEYGSIVPSDDKLQKDELIKRLKQNEIHSVPECGWSFFMSAARRGAHRELVDLYRDKQQINKLDCAGYNALALATLSRSTDCVQWLLDNGASIKSANQMIKNDALVWAASIGLHSYLKHLLEHGADICCCDDCSSLGSVRNRTALHYAARNGHVECVKTLVGYLNRYPAKKRIVLNQKDEEGRTPLMLAAWGKSMRSVKYLVDNGANVNETDAENSSALIMAAWGKQSDDEKDAQIVETLLSHNANPDIFEFNGYTALTYAAFHGRYACMKLLMQYSKAWITNQSTYQAILKYAVLGGYVNCARLLVEKLMAVCNSRKLDSLFDESFRREIEIHACLNNSHEQNAEAMIDFLKENGLIGELSSSIIAHLKQEPDALMNLAKAGKSQILEKIIFLHCHPIALSSGGAKAL